MKADLRKVEGGMESGKKGYFCLDILRKGGGVEGRWKDGGRRKAGGVEAGGREIKGMEGRWSSLRASLKDHRTNLTT